MVGPLPMDGNWAESSSLLRAVLRVILRSRREHGSIKRYRNVVVRVALIQLTCICLLVASQRECWYLRPQYSGKWVEGSDSVHDGALDHKLLDLCSHISSHLDMIPQRPARSGPSPARRDTCSRICAQIARQDRRSLATCAQFRRNYEQRACPQMSLLM